MEVRHKSIRKENMTYYFSVEGETEKWYLDWLQNCINECDEAKYKVKLGCVSKVESMTAERKNLQNQKEIRAECRIFLYTK